MRPECVFQGNSPYIEAFSSGRNNEFRSTEEAYLSARKMPSNFLS
jgi:hypothetical protein